MEKCNKTNVVALALIYNFISNGTNAISIDQFNLFKGLIDYNLYSKLGETWIPYTEDEQDYYHYDNKNGQIVLNNIYDLGNMCFYYVDNMPQEILKISLESDILSVLGVDRDKIKTYTKIEHKKETIGVYSASVAGALESVRNSLDKAGYKNIEIKSAFFTKFDDECGYNVSTSYDIEKLSIDLKTSCKNLIKL